MTLVCFKPWGGLARSVFRALTRLRGAAITSYDGVARSIPLFSSILYFSIYNSCLAVLI